VESLTRLWTPSPLPAEVSHERMDGQREDWMKRLATDLYKAGGLALNCEGGLSWHCLIGRTRWPPFLLSGEVLPSTRLEEEEASVALQQAHISTESFVRSPLWDVRNMRAKLIAAAICPTVRAATILGIWRLTKDGEEGMKKSVLVSKAQVVVGGLF